LALYLTNTAERLRAEGVKVRTELVHGHRRCGSKEMILLTAGRLHGDLIVMATPHKTPHKTHGRSGLQRLWLGSVAQKLVQSSKLPVLLMRRPEWWDKPAEKHEAESDLASAEGISTL
jgi:nucleotide-binding universal stress UspA family protein